MHQSKPMAIPHHIHQLPENFLYHFLVSSDISQSIKQLPAFHPLKNNKTVPILLMAIGFVGFDNIGMIEVFKNSDLRDDFVFVVIIKADAFDAV